MHCLGAWAAMDVALISVFGADGVQLGMGWKLVQGLGTNSEYHRKTTGFKPILPVLNG